MSQIRYRIEHETRYEHEGLASTSQHVACLAPRDLPYQKPVCHWLEIDPEPAGRLTRVDYFGNAVDQFAILAPYTVMTVMSRSEVDILPRTSQVDPASSPAWESVRDSLLYRGRRAYPSATEFSYPSPFTPLGPEVRAYAAATFAAGRPLLDAAIELMHRIHEEFAFDPTATSVATPLTRVLADRRGVCQDFAHLQIAVLRAVGLPARYVSGYLLTDPPPGQPRLVGADASHAWVSVWCPAHGWVDLDPTNDVLPTMRHITLAWGRDYGDVSPLRGVVLGGQGHRLHVGVSVYPIPT
ncbi:MAG: transglutaminase domain-containing protein [Vicinamibacterales bacterium]